MNFVVKGDERQNHIYKNHSGLHEVAQLLPKATAFHASIAEWGVSLQLFVVVEMTPRVFFTS